MSCDPNIYVYYESWTKILLNKCRKRMVNYITCVENILSYKSKCLIGS